ncbi:MAG: 50S ribosomal protein L10 [Chloroflexota bacterium]|nr:50S ribosomal protein L10 [Chloroflexota bacterium]
MRLEEKKQAVHDLAEKLEHANVVITTSYGGLTVAEMTELRRKLRAQKVEFRVIKNTLARFAAETAGREELNKIVIGPTAVAFGYDDIAAPAKALMEHIRATKSELKISGGLVEDRVLSAAEVASLASMPSREVLVAKMLGGLKGPLYGLVNVLNANLTGLVYLLSAREKQLEEGG